MLKFPSKNNMRLRLQIRFFSPFRILKRVISRPLPFFLLLSNLNFLLQLIQFSSTDEILPDDRKLVLSLILLIIPIISTLILLCYRKKTCTLPEPLIVLIVVFFLGLNFYIFFFVLNSKFDLSLLNSLLIWRNSLKTCSKKVSKTILLLPFAVFLIWKLEFLDSSFTEIFFFFTASLLIIIRKSISKNLKSTNIKKASSLNITSLKAKLDAEKPQRQPEQPQILPSLQEAILVFSPDLKLQYSNSSAALLISQDKTLSQSEIESGILSFRQDEKFLQLKGHSFQEETEYAHLIKAFKSKMALFGSLVTELNEESYTSNFSKKTFKSLISGQIHIRLSHDTCKTKIESFIDRNKIRDSKETAHKELKDVEKIKLKNLHFLNKNADFSSISLKAFNSIQEAKTIRETMLSFLELKLTNYYFFANTEDQSRILLVSFELMAGNVLVLIRNFHRQDALFSVWDMYEAQNKLLASMCHELRTPLNSITNMLELMENIEDDNESDDHNRTHNREYLTSAILNSKLLLSSINDFLDYFSFSASLFELKSKDFNIRELLYECESIFSPLATRKMVNFFVNMPDLDSYICCNDEERVKQIILNLLNNAFKFTSAGGTIILQLKSRIDAFEIFIRDTGVGIEPNQFKSLGNLRDNIKDTNERPKLGGFGLTISNILANYVGPLEENGKNYKGIKLRSEKSQGSRFSFLVGKKKVNAEENDTLGENTELGRKTKNIDRFKRTHHDDYHFFNPDNELIPYQISTVKCNCRRILAVDDNEFNLFVLTEQFKKKDFEIDTCSGGVEAVKRVEEILIDNSIKFCNKCRFYKLILMDIDMPIKDGYETTKEIKEMLRNTGIDVKIVALSAFSQEKSKEKTIKVGIEDYIEKPFSISKMEYLIHKYL